MSRVRCPKWGQHFLKNQSVCRKIADSLSLQPDDLLIEIGAGRGAMTRLLAARAPHLVAIEIDETLAEKLVEDFLALPHVEILRADILEIDFASLLKRHNAQRCYIFGNLPYYITSPILHHLFNARASIRYMTLLMQREVAERVTAQPGSRSYGYLTALTQMNAEARITLEVPPGAFSPPPKVHSALVDFPMVARFPLWKLRTHDAFLQFAQLCFQRKRKTLLNNLAQKYSRQSAQRVLEAHGLKENIRAEQLDLGKLAEIFKAVTVKAVMSDE
jgi:16S rRNA (adenine1518-N6/adenine1519-N6)-dimethyltransferase